ncbi:MAG: hypothetical protein JWN35_3219 [Frankiales bacterium]|nr:hypothetical protein [Frankiales bacterium]
MCRQASAVLPASPSTPRDARRFVGELCDRWGLGAVRDDLQLVLSELVTNAMLHARTPVTVTMCVTSRAVEIDVRDGDARVPVVRPFRTDLLGDVDSLTQRTRSVDDADPRHPDLAVGEAGSIAAGRGMQIVAGLSDRWGISSEPDDGKQVWALMPLPDGWPYEDGCVCDCEQTTAASGQHVMHNSGPWDRVS